MMVDRLIIRRSKLGFVRAVDEDTAATSLGQVLDLGKVKDREPYEALDWLSEQQVRIEQALARWHLKDGMLVLYDVSSSYFEGRHCPLARFGHSRDHRGDRLQIVYGCCARARGYRSRSKCLKVTSQIPRHSKPRLTRSKPVSASRQRLEAARRRAENAR